MRRGSQRRVVCGLNTHGCKPALWNALGLDLEHDSGGIAMPLSKRYQDAPEEIVKGLGANNVLGESFGRNVLGESFGRNVFFLEPHFEFGAGCWAGLGWVGLGWAGGGWGRCLL